MAKGKAVPLWLSVLEKVAQEKEAQEALKDVTFSLVIVFTDEDNECLSLIIDKGKSTSFEGEIPDYQAKVSYTSKVFEDLVTEKLSPMKAIQKRMLEIDGDLAALLNLVYLLPYMKKNYELVTGK
jgi:putative sterol carrier protein